jgi:uncharacterized protein with HEPN domain
MNKDKRDISVLGKIVYRCDRIASSIKRYGNEDALKSDEDYKDSVAMNILQIGELVTHLSDDFIKAYTEVPWRKIINMRNIAAHGYDKFEYKYMWGTMVEDVPALREFCVRIIEKCI